MLSLVALTAVSDDVHIVVGNEPPTPLGFAVLIELKFHLAPLLLTSATHYRC